MELSELTHARRRVIEALKYAGPLSVADLAKRLGLTDVAIRQHLAGLEQKKLVHQITCPPAGRGRPGAMWSLSDQTARFFPDHHAELTVGLIDAIRQSEGEPALRRIVEVRARDQVQLYQQRLPGSASPLKDRVEALAKQRTAEGYMAEVREESPESFLLIEHHCPICDAAKSCQGLCAAELQVFQKSLGDDVQVERIEHVLSAGTRCVYRIKKT